MLELPFISPEELIEPEELLDELLEVELEDDELADEELEDEELETALPSGTQPTVFLSPSQA